MDNLPRFSFYASGVPIVSAGFTLLATDFFSHIGDPSWVGTAFLLGYGLIYMNIVFVLSRRFMRRLNGPSKVPYLFAVLTGLIPAAWIFIYDAGLTQGLQIMFAAVMIIACFLGAYFGHKAGLKAQAKFQQQLLEYLKKTGEHLPDDLKRPHDNLSKN